MELTMSELQTVVAGWAAEEEQFSELMSPVPPTYPGEGSGESPLIPGPAQKIQVALRRKKNKHPSTINNLGESIPTQEVMNVIAAEDNGGDNDFEMEPWLIAIKDVRHEARLQQIPKDFPIWTPIKEIFDGTKNWGKIHKVSVCRFTRKGCIANITVANVDKVYTKENYIQPDTDSDETPMENCIIPDSEDEIDN